MTTEQDAPATKHLLHVRAIREARRDMDRARDRFGATLDKATKELSYGNIGEVLGIGRPAAFRLVQRYRRRKGLID